MKLYATVTGKKGDGTWPSKSQGSNHALAIDVLNERQEPILRIDIVKGEFQPRLEIFMEVGKFEAPIKITRRGTETKGKREKGEVCSWCGFEIKSHTDNCAHCGKHDGTSEENE